MVCANDQDPGSNMVYAVCDMTSRSDDAKAVQRVCGGEKIPFFAVFRAGSLLAGLQNSNIDVVKEFIATTVAEHSSVAVNDEMMFDEDF